MSDATQSGAAVPEAITPPFTMVGSAAAVCEGDVCFIPDEQLAH
ncbi:MAG TPA: hypothetical protein VNT53_09230 [Pseudolysinimonas sp.]|nr:hypothetical protein [Pseudolysinimonas sp.]